MQWSDILQAQHGVTPGTFGGTLDAYIACVHPDDRAALVETIAGATKSGADFAVHYRVVWPDETVRWIDGTGRVILNEEGQAVRGVGIALDVTERHTLEQQFHQAQKMDAIGRLAGGVAHDFNNLLTAILGYCELLLDETAPEHLHHEHISEIQKAGVSAAALTRQLLTFSRKQVVEPSRLDLSRVVTEMRPMLDRLIREDVTIVLDPAAVAWVMADRGQIEQVVMNLAINAQDAMASGGTLTIATENIELDASSAARLVAVGPGPFIRLSVKDSGGGMTPQVKARALEPFYTTKEIGKGTGLGLAIVHGIVVQGAGALAIHSEPGQGTIVEIYLPRVPCAVEAETPTPPARPDGGGECVLLVDDSEAVRRLSCTLLQRLGYRVLMAANAAEAVAILERDGPVDLILTDVVMPGMSGPELIALLGTQLPPLKVIYMSGYSEDVIAHHGVLNPGIAFLPKPFTAATLGHKVRETLSLQVADGDA